MAKKGASKIPKRKGEFTYRGYTASQLQEMSTEEFANLLPARQRRTLRRGMSEQSKKAFEKIRSGKNEVRTHCRGMVILPEMIGTTFFVHNGGRLQIKSESEFKAFHRVDVTIEMVGHLLGEFALTRKKVMHGSAGVGATRSSRFVPLK